MLPRPDVSSADARDELARRYLHVFGPTTAPRFTEWAGISGRSGEAAFESLQAELTAARTPIGDAWILTGDEADDPQSAHNRRQRRACCRAEIPTSCCGASTASSWSTTSFSGRSSGRRGFGPERCSSTVRSPEFGDAPTRSLRSRRGAACRRRSAQQSRKRHPPFPCPD